MESNRSVPARSFGDKLGGALRSRPEFAAAAVCALGGLLCALARIDGETAPFGVAFAAGAPQLWLGACVLGAAAGYLALGAAASYRCVAAVLLAGVARLAIGAKRWERWRAWCAPLLSCACVLVAGIIPIFYSEPLVYDVIMWLTQIVMAGASASFADKVFSASGDPGAQRLRQAFRRDKLAGAAAAVLAAIALMGLDAISLSGVSLGRIAAATAVLFASAAYNEAASALTGVICGLVIGFSSGDFTLYVTSYSLGGLLAGLFSAFGRRGSAVAFGTVYGFFGLLLLKSPAGFIEIALAATVFLLIPRTAFYAAGIAAAPSPDATLRDISQRRLESAADALREVSRTTQDVARRLRIAQDCAQGGLCDAVSAEVCGGCPYRCACWQEHSEETAAALRSAASALRLRGELHPDMLPRALDRCTRKLQLAQTLQRFSQRRTAADERLSRSKRCRAVVTEQLEAVGQALANMAEDIGAMQPAPNGLAQKLCETLAEQKLEPNSLLCWRDEYGRLALRCALPRSRAGRIDPAKLTRLLSESAGTALALPEKKNAGHEITLEFHQKPLYALETGCCRLPADSNPQCGDTVRTLTTDSGVAHILLSDGMGSGMNAALDSAMTASLAECLLEADIDHQSALRLINAALLVKSGDESLATLDAMRVDLFTGRASFFKAGAASSILLHAGRAVELAANSLPAGILDGVEFEAQERALSDGDLVIMTSDGAAPEGSGWILPLAENWKGDDLESFCRRLAKTAQLRRSDGRQDDITVVAARISRI